MNDQQRLVLDPNVEMYRTYLASAEAAVERRFATNRHYFAMVSALFVAYGYLMRGGSQTAPGMAQSVEGLSILAVQFGLPALVIVICLSWLAQLATFRRLSKAKYAVLVDLERGLLLKPFTLELAKAGRRRLLTGTFIDTIVPLTFIAVSALALALPPLAPQLPWLMELIGK